MACPRPAAPLPEFRLAGEEGALVTVGEALCACDPHDLCVTLLRCQAGWAVDPDAVGARRLRPLVSRVRTALRAMGALRPHGEAPPGHEALIPWESFEYAGRPGRVERSLGAALVPLGRADDARQALAACGGAVWGPVPPVADRLLAGRPGRVERSLGAALVPLGRADDARQALAACGGAVWGPVPPVADRLLREAPPGAPWTPDALDASLVPWGGQPWPRALGCALWVPRGQLRSEALQVSAALFWALTRRGFSARGRPVVSSPAAPAPRVARRRSDPSPADAALVRRLNYHAWMAALRAQAESARLMEVSR